MNFILTRYIYPIKEAITIADKLKFTLDNPRSADEIEVVLAHLEKSMNSPDEVYENEYHFRIPIYTTDETRDILTLESALDEFNKNYSVQDEYVRIFFEVHKEIYLLEKLAKMWIIARFDDEGEHERLSALAKKMKEEGSHGFFMLDQGNPIVDNCENLVSYCYLLSLLINTEDKLYHGNSFILNHNSYELQFPKVDKLINSAVTYFGLMTYSIEIKSKEDLWHSFYHIRDKITETSSKLNDVIDNLNKEKILYIANLLKVVGHEIKDERYKLVTLVSIIELLLTHNPDNSRFNVEDSISKQFRLKTSIIVYQNNKTIELEWIKERLKDIYNQRSNIAHGNFKSLKDYLRKELKKSQEEDMSEDIILALLTSDVYTFIRAIIEEYVKDRKLLEFLKDN